MATTTETQVNAADNPALANQLVAQALADQEVVSTANKPKIQLPPDTQVELAGGLEDPFDGVTYTAEIRELTGADEEAISKISEPGKALLTILDRAVVKIGDKAADKDSLDTLLAGDRELLLLAIRKATFGAEVTLGPTCPQCGEDQEFKIDLDADVEIKKLKEEDRYFTVNCKVGKVDLTLPKGTVQKALINSNNKSPAELDTILLKHCIVSINEESVINLEQVRNLSIKDRRDLIKAITDRNPGPQLSAVSKKCQACDQEVSLPLTLAGLFQE